MKRKRINAAAICSSANYVASRRAHRTMLEANHRDNASLFVAISQNVSLPEKSDIEIWEDNLKEKIRLFRMRNKESKINPFKVS